MKSPKTSISLLSYRGVSLLIFMLFLGAFIFSCSVKKNNSFTRSYHNFTTRYNVYYNGQKAFQEAYNKSLEELEESYVELIPFAPIYYKANSENALGTFQRAIEKAEKAIQEHSIRQKPKRERGWKKKPKAVAMQKKKEYNAYLKHAWLLLGKAQYYNAEFNKALSTFVYIANLYKSNEELYTQALLWQIRILILLDRTEETNELLKSLSLNIKPKTLKTLEGLHAQILTEYALKTKDYKKAIEHLPLSIKHTKNNVQKARLYYLMGQLYSIDSIQPKNNELAYKYFSKVLRFTPPQSLDFAARLQQSKLSPKGLKHNIILLERMSTKRRYQKNLDQIYYALGNSYLSLKDSTNAVRYFHLGADSSTLKQYDYLLNLISLGAIYLSQEEWIKAQKPIRLIASGLSNTHKDYNYYKQLSKGLDSLIIPAQIIYEQDSLLHLARMPEAERNAVIDQKIEAIKQKELAERKQAYQEDNLNNTAFNTVNSSANINNPMNSFEKGKFYFYNRDLLVRGRREFEFKWGKRKLEDFWNLRKKPVNTNLSDSLEQTPKLDSLVSKDDSHTEPIDLEMAQDPHERAFYLANIPFSREAKEQAKASIGQAMLEEARILRDKLDLLEASYKLYKQYAQVYPKSKEMEQVLYASYLLALRLNRPDEAEHYRLAYLRNYPKTKLASQLSDKNYLVNLSKTEETVQVYYTQAYKAYLSSNAQGVETIYQKVKADYSKSKLYPRFVFLSAMAKVISGNQEDFQKRLEELENLQLDKDAKALASSMLSEIKKGRSIIATSHTDFSSAIQSNNINKVDGENKKVFSLSTLKDNCSILLLIPKSMLSEAELIYYISLHNFVHYTQSKLDLRNLSSENFSALLISQFRSINDAQAYINNLQENKDLTKLKTSSYSFISIENSSKLLSLLDYQDYLHFLSKSEQNNPTIKAKLNYLANPPKSQIKEDIVKVQQEKAQANNSNASIVQGATADEKPLSYEDMEAIAKAREKEKRRLAKERLKEQKAKEQARERERKEKLRERHLQQKAKLKAQKETRKRKLQERRQQHKAKGRGAKAKQRKRF